MKIFSIVFLICLSTAALSNCRTEALNIAEEAVKLFNVNDHEFHCEAIGGLKEIKALPVIMVMPPRYSYEATFDYPCGPQPRYPKVTILLNQECKIVNLNLSGHKL